MQEADLLKSSSRLCRSSSTNFEYIMEFKAETRECLFHVKKF